MRNKTKKYKEIHLYFVTDKSNPYLDDAQTIPNILCVTATENDAKEYINKRLFTEKFDHYSQWCELRNLKIDNYSWGAYVKLLDMPYKYERQRVNYNLISSLLRLFYNCIPIGCSFDTLLETSALLSAIEDNRKVNEA